MKDVKKAILIMIFLIAYSVGLDLSGEPRYVFAYSLESNENEPLVTTTEEEKPLTINGIVIPYGYELWKVAKAKVTAYDPSEISCGKFADGLTSILHNAWRLDGCAVAPAAIPYGTLVYIPQVGARVADDTGAAMKKSWRHGIYHIDVRFTYPYQARQWGVKWLNVYLFRKAKA